MNESLRNAILYEIYPTSFFDSDGDGIGDLKGITEKLDYVKSLGVNLVWINPFFLSPFCDGGYDITDYKIVDPRFGTIKDFEDLVKKAKKLGLRILIDLVIGHTSVECRWFKESAKREHNEYSDYYIWTDSLFNAYKDKTIMGMYPRDGGYIVNYYACQPALNFGWLDMGYTKQQYFDENWKIHYLDDRLKPLRDEIIEIMKFWMSKGIDGFRVDLASSLVKKDFGNFDDEDDERIKGIQWVWNKLMTGIKKDYPNVIFLSEWVCPKVAVGKCGFDFDYIGHDCLPYNDLFRCEPGTNLMKCFENGNNYFSKDGKGDLKKFLSWTSETWKKVDGKGYFSVPSGCHDAIRLFSGVKDKEVMKTVYAFLLTFKHIPFFYYGDEIGMSHNFKLRKDGGGIRTGCRTPMQWNNDKNRGFSIADETYLPANTDKGVDVLEQENDQDSLLNCFKQLVKIRNEHQCLDALSDIEIISSGYPLIYKRTNTEESIIVYINPSDRSFTEKINYIDKVIFLHNASVKKDSINLNSQSFAIVKI